MYADNLVNKSQDKGIYPTNAKIAKVIPVYKNKGNKAVYDNYEIEAVVNKGKIGLSTHQNQWIFPINQARDEVASEFSLKGEFGHSILEKLTFASNIIARQRKMNITQC